MSTDPMSAQPSQPIDPSVMSRLPPVDPGGSSVQQRALASAVDHPTSRGRYGLHVGLTHVLAGGRTEEIVHEASEMVVVLSGELEMAVDGHVRLVRAGDHFVIASGAWHRFVNRAEVPASMLFAFGGDPAPITARRAVGDERAADAAGEPRG